MAVPTGKQRFFWFLSVLTGHLYEWITFHTISFESLSFKYISFIKFRNIDHINPNPNIINHTHSNLSKNDRSA